MSIGKRYEGGWDTVQGKGGKEWRGKPECNACDRLLIDGYKINKRVVYLRRFREEPDLPPWERGRRNTSEIRTPVGKVGNLSRGNGQPRTCG